MNDNSNQKDALTLKRSFTFGKGKSSWKEKMKVSSTESSPSSYLNFIKSHGV